MNFGDDLFAPIKSSDTLELRTGGVKHLDFSKLLCREMAATQRLMMEMPENRLALMTQIATVLACDSDGSVELQKTADSIYRQICSDDR